ncbi:MAG: SDR family NAD(P)-dependent oxidoreductase [Acidobacteria bacterium]|nr:SDR family NAD(P)-dependent oxidoreductase [Acidobacteriota bacterium]
MRIAGKVVLITGASAGIGAACAREFRRRGAQLALLARSADKLKAVAGDDVAVAGDVTVESGRRRVVEAALSRYGRIDILINNAGAGIATPTWNTPLDEVRRMYELNVFSALGMIQLVVAGMRERRSGCIVNIGSIAGKVTLPWLTIYSSSKYALGSITDGLRMELRRDGIHAMTVCPGYVSTGFQQHLLSGQVAPHLRDSQVFRITPEVCASAAADGVERGARTVVTPRVGWIFVALERLFPTRIDRTLENMYWRSP